MFATRAPKLRIKGWLSLIPVIAGQKRPVISAWSACNVTPPTDAKIAHWCNLYPDCGIGLAFGPDEVIGIDLDWTDPDLAQRAWDVTKDILGETPLLRVGRPPKRLALYRGAPGLVVDGKAFNGFEIFSRSGQCVLFGKHPQMGRPYWWVVQTSETVGPAELPVVCSEQIVALVNELRQIAPDRPPQRRKGGVQIEKPGLTSELLRALKDISDAPPVAAKMLAETLPGKRHNMMVAVCMALAMRRYSDAVIKEAITDVYIDLMDDLTVQESISEVAHAINWAREHAGPDDETVTRTMGEVIGGFAAAWHARWGRRG